MKSEIAQILARQTTRNKQILSKVQSMAALATLTEEACDELTIEHMLIGVTNTAIDDQSPQDNAIKKKRESKKARKEN